MPNLGMESRIPGYRGGFKVDEETGKVDKKEYSYFLEEAEKTLERIKGLEQTIKQKMKQELSGREDKPSETINEMIAELNDCQKLVEKWRTTDARKKKILSYIQKLEKELRDAEQELRLPQLAQEIQQLGEKIQMLLEQDRYAEMALKNTPPEEMADHNV